MYRIALLTEKNLKAQHILKTFVRNATSAMFQNNKINAQRYFRNCGGCALPTSANRSALFFVFVKVYSSNASY